MGYSDDSKQEIPDSKIDSVQLSRISETTVCLSNQRTKNRKTESAQRMSEGDYSSWIDCCSSLKSELKQARPGGDLRKIERL